MLSHLSIRDIVLIERLDIEFGSGLSVLTGETGAGKSILLDSLSLALGARGDAALVRHGAEQGQVTAVFDVPGNHPARAFLRENGFDDDGDVILRRIQTGEVFLMNWQVRDSLDGRYFGLTSTDRIIGHAVPLWTDEGGNGRFEWRAPTR